MADDTSTQLPVGSSRLFEADSMAILQEAPSLNIGLEMLEDTYSSKQWDDPNTAAATASEYAQQLRYRFEDTPTFSKDEVKDFSPINMDEIKGEGDTEEDQKLNVIDKWEKDYISNVQNAKDPTYVMVKDKLVKSVEETASNMRREIRGGKNNMFEDILVRAEQGMLGSWSKLVGADEYIKNVNEQSDKKRDEDFSSTIGGGLGLMGGIVGTAAINPGLAVVYLAGVGAGEVRGRYKESLAATGDSGRATTAAVIEAGSQALQLSVGGKIFGSTGRLIAKRIGARILGKPVEEMAVPAITKAVLDKTVGASVSPGVVKAATVVTKAGEVSTVMGASHVVSGTAQNYGNNNWERSPLSGLGKSMAAGAIFGAGTGGLDLLLTRSKTTTDPTFKPETGRKEPVDKDETGGIVNEEVTSKIKESEATTVEDVKGTQADKEFVTEEGDRYVMNESGNSTHYVAKTDEHFHPADRTFFPDEETYKKVRSIDGETTPDGKPIRVLTDGENLLVASDYVDKDLNITTTSTGKRTVIVQADELPSNGLVPLEVFRPKNLNGNSRVYRAPIYGSKIVEVGPNARVNRNTRNSSMGAAAASDWRERAVSQKIRLNTNIDEKVRSAFGEPGVEGEPADLYFRQTNSESASLADRVIAEKGWEGAAKDILSIPEDRNAAVDLEVGHKIVKEYESAGRKAAQAGDELKHEEFADIAIQVLDKMARMATGHGQASQVLAMMRDLDPELRIAALRKRMREQAHAELSKEEGIPESTLANIDTETNQLDTQIKTVAETGKTAQKAEQQAHDAEIAETESLISEIEKQAEARHTKYVEGNTREADAAQEQIETIEKTAADRQKSETDSLRESLNAAQKRVTELEAIEKPKAGETKELNKLKTNVQKGREKLAQTKSESALTAQEKAKIAKLKDLVADRKLKSSAVSKETFIKDKEAKQLDMLVRNKQRVTESRIKLKKDSQDYLSEAQKLKLKELTDKKNKLTKLKDKVAKKTKEKMDRHLPPEVEQRLKDLHEGVKNSFGTEQQGLLDEIQKIEHAIKTSGENKADPNFWYMRWMANQLSGVSTAVVNLMGNAVKQQLTGLSYTFMSLVHGNLDGAHFFADVLKSMSTEGRVSFIGEMKGRRTFRYGTDAEVKLKDKTKYGEPGRGDILSNPTKFDEITKLKYMGLVLRNLKAWDTLFFKSSKEATAKFVAKIEGRRLGLSGEKLKTHVSNSLFNSEGNWKDAEVHVEEMAQTMKKLGRPMSKNQKELAVYEYLEAKRSSTIQDISHLAGSRDTFTQLPDGVAGRIVKRLSSFAGDPYTLRGRILRPFKYNFPFLNFGGNFFNACGDHEILIGTTRSVLNVFKHSAAAKEKITTAKWVETLKNSEFKTKDFDKELAAATDNATKAYTDELQTHIDQWTSLAKVMTGATLAGTFYGLARAYQDDKDPYFDIIGAEPIEPTKREEFRANGGKPYSFKIGTTYIRFAETPFALVFGELAALRDLEKGNNGAYNRAEHWKAAGIVMASTGRAFLDNSFLKGLAGLFDAVQNGDTGAAQNILDVALVNPLKGFIPGAALLREASKFTNNPIDRSEGDLWSQVASGIPGVQAIGTRPALNAFGQPIERSLTDRLGFISRFWTHRNTDPAWRWLAENDYGIPATGLTIRLPKSTPKNVTERRAAMLGEAFENILTSEQRYSFVETSGPLIREKVLEYAKRYGGSGHQDAVQTRLSADINRIKSKVRYDLFIRGK